MESRNYIIEYTVKKKDGTTLKSGKVKAKNKMSELDAQIKFESWLKEQHSDFGQLIVHDCYADDSLDFFKNFFGIDNPFL